MAGIPLGQSADARRMKLHDATEKARSTVTLLARSLALLSGLGRGSSGGGMASRFGLDEIGSKGPGSGGDVRNAAITLGKRLSQDFYVTYESSLAGTLGTLGTLFIFYDLTRRLTLRGQAGQVSGVDLIHTIKYDRTAKVAALRPCSSMDRTGSS